MIEILEEAEKKKKATGGKPNQLEMEDRLLMSLEYLREYRTYFHVASSYGISESACYRNIKWIEDVLIKHPDFALPGRKSLVKSDVEYENVIEEWVQEVLMKRPKGSELILDDCSTDGTREILKKLQGKYSFIKINFAKRDGFFNSTIRLYKLAKCNLIFFTDSDGQYIPKEFWKVAKHINDYDMVHGVKEDRKDPLYRVIVSCIYNSIVHWLFNIYNCADINSAFRLIKRPLLTEVLNKVHCLKMLPNSGIAK